MEIRTLSTDVLIIGTGAAGLRAAIEAKRCGARVVLVSKSKTGLATCTACAGGIFRASRDREGIRRHYEETVSSGRFLNDPKLVRILVKEAWSSLKELEKFGVKLQVEGHKTSVVADRLPAGAALSKALTSHVLGLNIDVLERTVAFGLMVEGNRCHGGLFLCKDTGEVLAVSAKSTVLATGGYSRLYSRNDNPPTMTGDGLILAFRAGAELQDLEFTQFQPMFTDVGVPRMPILDWLIEATKNLVEGGPLVNSRGERFLDRYGLLEQEILRDSLTIAVEREIFEGRGTGDALFFDLRKLSPQEIVKSFSFEYQKRLAEPFSQILPRRKLHVASCAHYTMGGVRIDECCGTGIEGLYAVGEVSSGIHGANRLGGNALSEVIVFGKIAGRQAAENAKKTNICPTDVRRLKESLEFIDDVRNRSKSKIVNPIHIKETIVSAVSKYCRPVRSDRELRQGLEHLKEVEEEKAFMCAKDAVELQAAIEADFMLSLASLVLRSARLRKESRGSHFRVDYPKNDDEKWLKNIVFKLEDGREKVRLEPVVQNEMRGHM